MAKTVYKPLKKREWGKVQRDIPLKAPNGRIIETVQIGIIYDRTGSHVGDILENIYADVAEEILSTHSRLKISVNITCTPKLVVFDGNDIIPHNPDVPGHIARIREVLPAIDEDIYYRAYRKSWEMTVQKKTMDYAVKALIQEVNEKTGGNYPPDLIISIMRRMEAESFFASDEENTIRNEISSFDDEELKIAAADAVAVEMYDGSFKSQVMLDALADKAFENGEVINMIMQEVFKRYILI